MLQSRRTLAHKERPSNHEVCKSCPTLHLRTRDWEKKVSFFCTDVTVQRYVNICNTENRVFHKNIISSSNIVTFVGQLFLVGNSIDPRSYSGMENSIYVLAYYSFTSIEDPHAEVAKHKEFFATRDVRSRIYISHEGINGQMSASPESAEDYMAWLKSDSRFADVEFKIHHYHEHVFPRCSVKYRSQIVALDAKVDAKEGGEHVPPSQWRQMLQEKDEDTLLLDVRNDYEWALGHFEGAELPTLETFREFPDYARELKQTRDPKKTKVMMYCTGGIRCELYSALMKKEGFEKVYQLQGGIIKYGLEEGSDGWLGKLFVFDDRLSVPISEKEEAPAIGKCYHCGEPSETYYNCANMDCNELFLSCPSCADLHKGCCCAGCLDSPRLRPYEKGERPKPFRRWYQYLSSKQTQ